MKKQRGITLIGLVVTIIVLLILAGVSISLSLGQNGILTQAQKAVKDHSIAEAKEKINIGYTRYQIALMTGQEESLKVDGAEVVKNADNTWKITFTKTGDEYILSADGKIIEEATKYAIVFKNYDGTVLQALNLKEGTIPSYTGATPAKASDSSWNYVFNGWSPSISAVTGTQNYVAQYVRTQTFTFNGNTYTFEENMTWEQFVDNTTYNTAGFEFNADQGCICLGDLKIKYNGSLIGYLDLVSHVDYDYEEITICCFDPESQVLMAYGTTRNIEDVKIGDMIMSINEDTGEFISQKVKNTIIKHNSDDLVYVNLSDGTRIGMRAYHPLLTTDGWKSLRPTLAETIIEAGKSVKLLEIGDVLVGYNGNVTVVSIEQRPDIENYDTYNLSVDGYHNYIVDGIVVHNAPIKCGAEVNPAIPIP